MCVKTTKVELLIHKKTPQPACFYFFFPLKPNMEESVSHSSMEESSSSIHEEEPFEDVPHFDDKHFDQENFRVTA